MDAEGTFAPETEAAVRERYASLGPTAQVVVREVAKAMAADREEYDERVTEDVVATAHDALFAGVLRVRVGSAEEFTSWRDAHPDYEVHQIGSQHVERVAWHAAPFAKQAVAATFENEERAAVDTLRRVAFGRLYRERVR